MIRRRPSLLLATALATALATNVAPAVADVARAAAVAAPATDDTALDRYVATLDTSSLDDEPQLRSALRSAEAQLARARVPRRDCAAALGAERYAGLYVALGRARQALGDHSGARAAWQAAIACAPRIAEYRVGLATVLLTLGELDAANAALGRVRLLAPDAPGLEPLQARVDYAAGRWTDAATRAAQIAERLQRASEAAFAADAAVRTPRSLPPDANAADAGSEMVAFWRILELLARRRAGEPAALAAAAREPDLALGGRWPEPIWRHLHGRLGAAGVVAAIRAVDSPRRRREMSCEALYYVAQQTFAAGADELARRRLARVVTLKVPYFVEHELALAELARLRRAP